MYEQRKHSLQLPYGVYVLYYIKSGVCVAGARCTMFVDWVRCVSAPYREAESPSSALLCVYGIRYTRKMCRAVPFGARNTSFVHVLSQWVDIFNDRRWYDSFSSRISTHTCEQIFVENNSSRESICARSLAMFYFLFFSLGEFFSYFLVDLSDDNFNREKKSSSSFDEIAIDVRRVAYEWILFIQNVDVIRNDEILLIFLLNFIFVHYCERHTIIFEYFHLNTR